MKKVIYLFYVSILLLSCISCNDIDKRPLNERIHQVYQIYPTDKYIICLMSYDSGEADKDIYMYDKNLNYVSNAGIVNINHMPTIDSIDTRKNILKLRYMSFRGAEGKADTLLDVDTQFPENTFGRIAQYKIQYDYYFILSGEALRGKYTFDSTYINRKKSSMSLFYKKKPIIQDYPIANFLSPGGEDFYVEEIEKKTGIGYMSYGISFIPENKVVLDKYLNNLLSFLIGE